MTRYAIVLLHLCTAAALNIQIVDARSDSMFRRNRSPNPKTPTLLISYYTFTDCCLLQLICRMLSSDVFGHFYRDAVLVHLVNCFWPARNMSHSINHSSSA